MVTAGPWGKPAVKCLHQHCWVKLQCIKVISLAGITCDSEKEMLILTMYLKKYLKKSNTLGKYLNTNTFNS